MKFTEHFSFDELIYSSTAQRHGIENNPPGMLTAALFAVATGLEKIRTLLGNLPIHIDSGYRCPELNTLVGGAKDSAHMRGYAADFTCGSFGTPLEIIKKISESDIQFDQIIQEGTWVHISFAPTMRRQILTAHFGPEGTTYSEGI